LYDDVYAALRAAEVRFVVVGGRPRKPTGLLP
jgi:hypothetical protein